MFKSRMGSPMLANKKKENIIYQMIKGVRFHDFEKILIAPIKSHINSSVMHDCIFGHYLVMLDWTYNHANFKTSFGRFPFWAS